MKSFNSKHSKLITRREMLKATSSAAAAMVLAPMVNRGHYHFFIHTGLQPGDKRND